MGQVLVLELLFPELDVHCSNLGVSVNTQRDKKEMIKEEGLCQTTRGRLSECVQNIFEVTLQFKKKRVACLIHNGILKN